MPWCPVCKNEYKDGYTLCADCGAELVDFLKEEENPEIIEKPLFSEEEINALKSKAEELNIDSSLVEDPIALKKMLSQKSREDSVKPYVKASERAENYKTSAYALLFVGICGAVFLVLSYFNILPIALAANINFLFYLVMGIMFLAFIIMGFKSLSAAKVIADTADDENALTESIYKYFRDNYSSENIDALAFGEEAVPLSEEERFFPRSNYIKELIVTKFGELDEAYLTELTENIYSFTYES